MQVIAVENHEAPSNDSAILKALLIGFIGGGIVGGCLVHKVYSQNNESANARALSIEAKAKADSANARKKNIENMDLPTYISGVIKRTYEMRGAPYVILDVEMDKQFKTPHNVYKFICQTRKDEHAAKRLANLLKESKSSEFSMNLSSESLKSSRIEIVVNQLIKAGNYTQEDLKKELGYQD